MNFLERIIDTWRIFLNNFFDFGSYGGHPLSEKGALLILFLTVTVLVLLLTCLIVSGPEQLPGT